MPFSVKRVMDIDRGIKVGIGLVVTHRTNEQFSPFHCDALAVPGGEPLPLCAASGAILGCPMCIDLHADDLLEVRFVFCLLIDFAAQLVGTPAVHAPRFAPLARLDLAQALEEQDTPRIVRADLGNLAGYLVRHICVEPIHMPPELLVAMLAFDRLARLPLLPGDAPQMVVAVGVQTMIGHEHRLDDRAMLSDRDHRQVFDIEIDAYCHQVWVLLALHHLAGCDLLHLRDMQCCRMGSQDQRRALPLPVRFLESRYEVVAGVDRVVYPSPSLCCVDVDAHKGCFEIEGL